MPSLVLFSFCLFVLSNSNVIDFVLFHYYPLEVGLFSNERQRGNEPDGRGGGEALEGIKEGKL